jgi:class 3 adenylate cyclase
LNSGIEKHGGNAPAQCTVAYLTDGFRLDRLTSGQRSGGRREDFVGDGLMVYFNDPLPCSNPAERAVALAVAMRDAVAALAQKWRRHVSQIYHGSKLRQSC